MPERIRPVVELEEDVYAYTPADNGAGPMWCFGSTTLVRHGDTVYTAGLETIPDAKPLNNVRWTLHRRRDGDKGWSLLQRDPRERTREPSPLAVFDDGRLFMSVNPTRAPIDSYDGPAEPGVLEFDPRDPAAPPRLHQPRWDGRPGFREHSYRSFVADPKNGELLLMNNIGYTHAQWSLMERDGRWISTGLLKWPWGADYEKPEDIRLCYPSVAIVGRAVHFFGVSDIIEPNSAWRDFKIKLTGQKWDYDFRRLFYAWTPDITKTPFSPWLEVASREKTCGMTYPCDLYVAADGAVHLLWRDKSIDERLREKFFPKAAATTSLEHAVLRGDKVVQHQTLAIGGEGHGTERDFWGRYHVTADGRLVVIANAIDNASGKNEFLTRIHPITDDPESARPIPVQVREPITGIFFTASPRAGSAAGDVIDMIGPPANRSSTIRYVRVRL